MTREIIGIIPVRYGSSRFPGKPLALIAGKTLLQRTYEQAKQASRLTRLVVATDDQRIFDHARAFGADVVMTSRIVRQARIVWLKSSFIILIFFQRPPSSTFKETSLALIPIRSIKPPWP